MRIERHSIQSARAAVAALILFFVVINSADSAPPATPECRETVVLVHALGRSRSSLSRLAGRLRDAGYAVLVFDYASTRQSVADSAAQLRREMEELGRTNSAPLHFVTHSIGGIVVRAFLKQGHPTNLGRVVMLSPPNQGSEIVDRLRSIPFYKLATGPAGQELGTEPTSTPNQLGAVDFDLGVIAGNRTIHPVFSTWLPGQDDGKVSVQRTRVEGMSDFLVLPLCHTFMARSSKVAAEVIHFLSYGRFERTPS